MNKVKAVERTGDYRNREYKKNRKVPERTKGGKDARKGYKNPW